MPNSYETTELLGAALMEERRLLFTNLMYAKQYRAYMGIHDWDARKLTKEARQRYDALKRELLKEREEYTASEKFDPVKAKKARRILTTTMKNYTLTGNWWPEKGKRKSV
ncbi:hypothetical protein WJU16_06275 [Chitinophaga pollutisoli]|uniref:Uncharacterized protein n=1 Tax=Chitinophaga pollutisoli TaxID=3133966 RepID=A0ABZ2YS71_9BACT